MSTLLIRPLHTVFPQALRPPPVWRLLRDLVLNDVTRRFALPKHSPHNPVLQPFLRGSLNARSRQYMPIIFVVDS